MIDVRRWYIYLVSAITIQASAWAMVALSRHLLLESPIDREIVALEMAAIIVALPLFLAHWLWAQRLAGRDPDEPGSFPRRLYLVAMMAAFLAAVVYNAFNGLQALLNLAFGVRRWLEMGFEVRLPAGDTLLFTLPALVVMGALWGYHWTVRRGDNRLLAEGNIPPEGEGGVVLGQLYRYGFAVAGLVMSAVATGRLVARLLAGVLPGQDVLEPLRVVLALNLALLVVGLVVWLVFWLPAQRRFNAADAQERASVVRKVTLYAVIFVGALGVIITATVLLADLIARVMAVPSEAGGLSTALAIILVCGALWAYHAFELRRDAAAAPEVAQQAQVRRIYTYLMAGLGLAALLIGAAGMLTTLFQGFDDGFFSRELRETLAAFMAAIIAGLPVWLWHWWQAGQEAAQPHPAGIAERRAIVRRLYLYLFVFAATLMILGSVIFMVSQLLMLLLGERGMTSLAYELAQAFSITVIGMAVWVYHGLILRQDGRAIEAAEAAQLKSLHIAVVDVGDGSLGHTLAVRLHDKVPGAIIQPVGLTPAAMAAMNGGVVEKPFMEVLNEAEVIVGPWSMAVPAGHGGIVSPEMAATITASHAQKVLFPEPEAGYTWTGVEAWKIERIAGEVVDSVRALSLGEKPAGNRPATWFAVLAVFVVIFLLLNLLPRLLGFLFGL